SLTSEVLIVTLIIFFLSDFSDPFGIPSRLLSTLPQVAELNLSAFDIEYSNIRGLSIMHVKLLFELLG
ncbi:MAG: hypothetical protein KAJ96_10705, partial [Candidatus Thorarchaeota archaeon]|nr:hypothetical protein [Candidatus Thorarchaeota archaeon]